MTLRQYFTIMFLATFFCWLAWWMVLINVDPFQKDTVGFVFFYLSLGLATIGTISLGDFLVRRLFSRGGQPLYRLVKSSFRDALLVALAIIFLLFLQGSQLLRWWNLVVFCVLAILVWALSFNHRQDVSNL